MRIPRIREVKESVQRRSGIRLQIQPYMILEKIICILFQENSVHLAGFIAQKEDNLLNQDGGLQDLMVSPLG